MCLAVPAKVIELEGEMATVDLDGVHRAVSTLMVPDLALGDYVITHAGFALHKVDETEAQNSLDLLREMVDAVAAQEQQEN